MKPHMNKLLLTSFSIGSAAVLIGPAISVLTQQHTSVINESKQLGQPKETTKQSIKNAKVNQVGKRFKVSKTYAQKFKDPGDNTISASEIPNIFGGDSDFSATLGFAHSTESGRGWNNMFWGNQWDFNLHTKANDDSVWNRVGIAHPRGIAEAKDQNFKFSDDQNVYQSGSTDAVLLNEGARNSTLSGKNYAINVDKDNSVNDGGQAPTWIAHLRSNFDLSDHPKSQDSVSSAFLLLMYSMFISGEGSKLTGDPTADTTPEFLFVQPVFQLHRTSPPSKFTNESIAAAIGSGVLDGIIGGLDGGFGSAIGSAVGTTLTSLLSDAVTGGDGPLKTSLSPKVYMPITGSKNFLWNQGIKLKDKYFSPDSPYKINKFFVNDIQENANAVFKLSYDGWNGWKPFISFTQPSLSFSYTISGTKTTHTSKTYDYANWDKGNH